MPGFNIQCFHCSIPKCVKDVESSFAIRHKCTWLRHGNPALCLYCVEKCVYCHNLAQSAWFSLFYCQCSHHLTHYGCCGCVRIDPSEAAYWLLQGFAASHCLCIEPDLIQRCVLGGQQCLCMTVLTMSK